MKEKHKFAVVVELDGYSKGDVYLKPAEWLKGHADGSVITSDFDTVLKLGVKELTIDVPEDLDGILKAHREEVKQARIAKLEKELAEAKGES